MQNYSTKNLLIIDDDLLTLKITKRIFEDIGFQRIQYVTTAKEGLNIIDQSKENVDLIILDLNMPDIDGIQTIRKLNELEYKGNLIIFSGEDLQVLKMSVALAKARNIKTIGTLTKPASKDKILEILNFNNISYEHVIEKIGHEEITFEMIKSAILQEKFEPWFQPIIDIKKQDIIGVETLARWKISNDQMIPPDKFIPIAEKYNLIDDVTEIIVRKLISSVETWILSDIDLCISLNISSVSLKNISFPEKLYKWFKVNPAILKKLTVEITESKLIDDILCPLDVLLRLNLKKVKLSIDDFGTGYSDINQLKNLPFNELKIDKSYVHNASSDEKLRAILESSVTLGKKLNLNIVAEGIESRDDLKIVTELGCDQAQGYYFAKPMPHHEIINFMQNWHEIKKNLF